MNVTCPGCRDPKVIVPRENPSFPFCSERCRAGDLQNWLNEGYRVPAEPAGPGDLGERTDDEGP